METMKREWGGSRGQKITGLFKMLIREVHKKSWETSEMSERQYPAYFSETEQHVQATLTVYNSQIQPPLSEQADCQEPYKLQATISPAVCALTVLFPHLVTSGIKSPTS